MKKLSAFLHRFLDFPFMKDAFLLKDTLYYAAVFHL